ncbi:MAG: restriction endonuclease subunit S [Bacteroidales bacterium]|nr:restriction endonuclease subunit S [Bacteroidales bacterium]
MTTYPTYKLGEILSYEQPTNYIVESTEYNDSYPIPVLTAGKSFILGYTNETSGVYDKLPVIIFDDFTTASKFVDFKFKVKSSAMKILSCNEEIADIKYMYYLMQITHIQSDTHKRYWISDYSKIPVNLPPLPTQHAIVSCIETLFAKLDKAVQHLRTAQQQIKTYRQAVLNHWLNNDEGKWKKKTAEECVVDENYSLAIGPFGSDLKVEDYTESGVKLVFVRDITSGFEDKKNKYVSEFKADQLKAHNVFKGDLLITKMGDPPGQTGIFPFDRGVITSDVLRMKTNDNILNKYYAMYYILSSEGGKQIKEMTQGVAQKKISLGRFKKFIFPIPSISEQQRIVAEIESRLSQAEAVEASIEKALQQSEALRQSILKKAFGGELVVSTGSTTANCI